MEEFDIYLRGFEPGRGEAAAAGLARAFGLDPRRARELVQSLPRVVKRRVPGEHVERYAEVLRALGGDFELRRSPLRPLQVIAVVGGEDAEPEARAAQQHGSTLTLPPPSPELAAIERRASQRATTMVENGWPPAPAGEPVPSPAAELPARAVAATAPPLLAEHSAPAPVQPARSAALAWKEPASLSGLPPRSAPAPARRSPSPSAGELPPPWEIPGLDARGVDGRPSWLVEGARAVERPALVAAAGTAPTLQPRPESSAPGAPAPASLELGVERVERARSRAVQRPRSQAPAAVAAPSGASAEPAQPPPFALRLALRFGLGLSLFMIVTALRSAFDSDVSEALAAWGEAAPEAAAPEAALARPRPAAAAGYGPPALEWLRSDLHQFSNPDKDAVRSRIKTYKAAGALEVYVGNIMRSGPLQIAGELIVELPSDPERRKAVLAAHQRVLASTFGGFAPAVDDAGGPVLRVTL